MKLFNRQGWWRTLLLAAALAAVGLLGCMITTSGPDDYNKKIIKHEPHTHTWGDWVITTPATCDAAGVETRTCTQDASHNETRAIARLTGTECNHVHTWSDWTVLSPATCDAQGVETRTCTQDANHKETRMISQLTGAACNTDGGDHVHTWGDWIVLAQATCDVPGVEMRRCTQNPNHIDSRQTPPLTGAACGNSGGGGDHVHTWGNWAVITPATCSATGVEMRTCTQDASHKETRAIAQLTGAACNTGGGGSYESVTIGGQKWMKRNLNIETADSWCYENSADSCAKYGRLYTWEAAKKACPSGWRLPDTADWDKLVTAAGGWLVAGKALKSTSGWENQVYGGNGNGTDNYGFSALPGGLRSSLGRFLYAGSGGYWLTATDDGYILLMSFYYDYVRGYGGYETYGVSVRCIAD